MEGMFELRLKDPEDGAKERRECAEGIACTKRFSPPSFAHSDWVLGTQACSMAGETDTLISNFHDFSLRWNFSPGIEWGISRGSGLQRKEGRGWAGPCWPYSATTSPESTTP